MHGSLLGWWWNQAIMPWDSDVDVQMTLESMSFLAEYHNMTIHHFALPQPLYDIEEEEGDNANEIGHKTRDYLLEINPHYKNGSVADSLNMIDARWIDTETGLFIDITTLRRNATAEEEGKRGHMMCKDKHHYLEQDIFPLRISTFEGVPAMIPYAYSELLEEEYGRSSLTQASFEGYTFSSALKMWRPLL